ncbi:hypothetical protein E2C01_038219 [Portunus trituberculatus]|uniref:Uncharacterized protein n=1 Tax=Portunus trituberculatus TaxID=210409 RepID=A0A5B7FG90_PORTR|nr:hypothetical protein [Portunus trituberculatus]
MEEGKIDGFPPSRSRRRRGVKPNGRRRRAAARRGEARGSRGPSHHRRIKGNLYANRTSMAGRARWSRPPTPPVPQCFVGSLHTCSSAR